MKPWKSYIDFNISLHRCSVPHLIVAEVVRSMAVITNSTFNGTDCFFEAAVAVLLASLESHMLMLFRLFLHTE